MREILKKKVLLSIIAALTFVVSIMTFFVNSPNVYAADLKTVVLKATDFTGEGEGSDNPWTLSNSSWELSNLAFYNYWNKDEISRTETGQGSAFSSSITYKNPSKYAIVSVKVYGAGRNLSNTVDVSVTCGSETTAAQTVTQDGTNLDFNLSTNPTSSVVINFQHPAYTETAKIELYGEDKGNTTFIEITAKESYQVTISSGAGVKSVYLSTNQNATSGSSSGTNFISGDTVYGFAKLAKGYKAKSGWTLVSGSANTENAIYRVGSKTVGSSAVDFGSISADLITYDITYNLAGGTHGNTHPATYNVTTNTFTISNPTKTGYTFKGWSGTGLTGDSNKNVSIANGSIGNRTYTANWTANTYTVTFNKQNGTGGSDSVTATYDSAMPFMTKPTRTGYTFAGYYDNTSGGTQYYTATGESAKNWDKAEATTLYARWTFNPDEVIGLINDIGGVNYPNSRESLFKAEEVYNALEATDQTAFQTTYSNDYKTLTDARIEYDAQKAVKVQEVKDAINDIGEVKYPNSKEKIVNAETLYNALDENEKNTTVITNYETLTGSRATFDDLRAAAIQDVMDKIDAITPPLVYPNSNSNINTARTAFDALHADDKNDMVVTNYQNLLDSEAAYYVANEVNEIGNPEDTQEFRDKVSAVRNEYNNLTSKQKALFPDKENDMLNDYEAAIMVMDLINAIGDVKVTPESKALIDTANESYEALTDTQKLLVANYDELISDNTDYDEALAVVNKIHAIGDGKYSEEKQALITDARESFNALTEYQKSIVYNSRLLYDKEVEATEILIDNIGSVQYTSISKSLIDIASASYNALDSNLKQEVTNYRELLKANNDYNKVDTFVNKVNSLGDLTYSETSNENITNARELIDALTADQKAILPEKSENTLINYEKAYAAIEKIHSIGKVKYSTGTEKLVKDAREAYDELTPEQKELINNEDFSLLAAKEEKLDDTRTTAIAWGVILILLALTAIGAGIFFIFFLLFKDDNDDDDKSLKNQNVVKASSSALPLIILTSHFFTGPYRAFYILLTIAVLVWIGVAVIYILKKKGIIKTIRLKFKKDSAEEDDDNTKTE